MKKLYFSLVTFMFLVVAQAQIVNIPSVYFKAKLLSAGPNNTYASSETPVFNSDGTVTVSSYHKIDTNNDGQIQVSEAQAIKYLAIPNSNMINLEGIRSFTNISYLDCSQNNLISLNVQGLTNLQFLDCSYNQLISLNMQGLTSLIDLNCAHNQLPSLNVQGSANLKTLYCSNNQLPSLNVQGLTNLQTLGCCNNNYISLNVQGLTNLQYLICFNNQLTSLNVQGLANLQNLYCANNQITSLNIQGSANLKGLDCNNNQLTELFIKNNNVNNWNFLHFSGNSSLAHICADEEDISLVQTKINEYGYTNCSVNSNCSLSVDNNPIENNYFSIYPNPVKNKLNLSTKQATTIYSLSIYNILGQQVQTTTNPEKTIDVTGLQTGNYIVKVTTNKGVSSSKFVKE